jgi:hypothetical protein
MFSISLHHKQALRPMADLWQDLMRLAKQQWQQQGLHQLVMEQQQQHLGSLGLEQQWLSQ